MKHLPSDKSKKTHSLHNRKKAAKRRSRLKRMLIPAGALLIVCLIGILCFKQALSLKKEKAALEASKRKAKATITAAGDIMLHQPLLDSPLYYNAADNTYDYSSIFKYIRNDYEASDFVTATFEGSLTGGDYDGFPTFKSPDAIAAAMKENSIDLCLLANNHIYDASDEGLKRTMQVMDDIKLPYAGVRKTASDSPYSIRDINGIKVGIFNYVFETEPLDGRKTINGISVNDESESLINSFREEAPDTLYQDIKKELKEMERQKVEFTIAYLHWGTEYQTTESEYQHAIAQKLCDMGIDALIGSHPHVIQPVDVLTSADGSHKMFCAYAIGNLISNQRTENMDGLTFGHSEDGLMVTLTIKRNEKGAVTLTDAEFVPIWMYHTDQHGNEYYILPLDNPKELESKTGLQNLTEDVDASLSRTYDIIGNGVQKVEKALPLK